MINGIGSSFWSQFCYKNYSNQGTASLQPSKAEALVNSGVTGLSQAGSSPKIDNGECQACKKRKYQDVSNDPGVSMKAPTKLSPGEAASRVSAHEQEHVAREQAKAETEDRKIVSQTVQIQTAVCPECGRFYVSGGVTKTVSKTETKAESDRNSKIGKLIDTYA